MNGPTQPKWQQVIWTGAGVSLVTTILLLLALVAWTIGQIVDIVNLQKEPDLGFVVTSIGVLTLTLLRFLAELMGAAIAFAGLAVSFFAHQHANSLSVGAQQNFALPPAALRSHSPGIVGVVIGAVIIVCALFAKSTHNYEGPQTIAVLAPPGASAASAQDNNGGDNRLIPSGEEKPK